MKAKVKTPLPYDSPVPFPAFYNSTGKTKQTWTDMTEVEGVLKTTGHTGKKHY